MPLPTVNGIQLVKTMNNSDMKAPRYLPTEKEIQLSNHNKSDLTLVSPRAKASSKVTLVSVVSNRSSHTIS